MFDFEKLDVYKVVKDLNTKCYTYIMGNGKIESFYRDKWMQSSLLIVLNLAEGVGRNSTEEKRKFITASRAKVFECVSILQSLKDIGHVETDKYDELYNDYETASKMLLGMYRSFK